jgi:hypothetical protein
MQVAIRDSAKLYFLKDNPDAQIILHTDASDYGYGAYLCQVVGECEYPVLFMSKSFHGAKLNWNTQDKECGAIYNALEKFQYLLFNKHLILETDNLLAGVQMKVGYPTICFQHQTRRWRTEYGG